MTTSYRQREECKLMTYIKRKAKVYPGISWIDIDYYGGKLWLIDDHNLLYGQLELDFIPAYDGRDYMFFYNDKKIRLFQVFRMMVKNRES